MVLGTQSPQVKQSQTGEPSETSNSKRKEQRPKIIIITIIIINIKSKNIKLLNEGEI